MPDINTILLFLSASLLLALAPGPDNIFVLAQGMTGGARAGLLVTLGLCTGLLVHTTVVSLGLGALFRTSVLAFNILKFLGAAYLAYLAVQSFRAAAGKIEVQRGERLSAGILYRRGIIMNVTNPKVSIFFLAFLPQFTDPSRGPLVPQFVALGLVFILATIIVFGMISIMAGKLGGYLSGSDRAQRYLDRMAGTVFALLAVRLVFISQR